MHHHASTWLVTLAMVCGLGAGTVAAQPAGPTPEQRVRCEALPHEISRRFCIQGYALAPLAFAERARELSAATTVGMGVYRPSGPGPFPVIVLLHTCESVRPAHMRYWVEAALERGYVAFVLDSWTQRSLGGFGPCPPRADFSPIAVRTRDAMEALAHLAGFDFVDKARIGVVGFSQGGRVAYLLASRVIADIFPAAGLRYAAVASFYGECYNRATRIDLVKSDIDVPLLALLGELDEDGDPKECVPRLQAAKDRGAPVEWHVYPGAAHIWDHAMIARPTRYPYYGSASGTALAAYDRTVTEASRERLFAFLGKQLRRK